MTIYPLRIGALALSGVSLALVPVAAPAQGAATGFAGFEAGRGRLAYAGLTAPLPGNPGASGWAIRPSAAYSRYDYRRDGVRIEGENRQAELSLLRQASGPWGYADVGVGARYRSTDLSPADPAAGRQGERWELVASASGQRDAGPWRASGFGSYGFSSRSYYVRGEVDRAVRERLALGVEAVFDGDRRFSRGRGGLVATVRGSGGAAFQLAAGAARSSGRTDGYGAVRAQWSF